MWTWLEQHHDPALPKKDLTMTWNREFLLAGVTFETERRIYAGGGHVFLRCFSGCKVIKRSNWLAFGAKCSTRVLGGLIQAPRSQHSDFSLAKRMNSHSQWKLFDFIITNGESNRSAKIECQTFSRAFMVGRIKREETQAKALFSSSSEYKNSILYYHLLQTWAASVLP